MVKQSKLPWVIIGLLAVALVIVSGFMLTVEPEVVTEVVTETVEADCPVVEEVVCEVCEICAEPVVCEVIDEDLQEQQDVRELIEGKILDLVEDSDFIEDDLIPSIESFYDCELTDEDDLLKVEIESIDVDWDVDDEEGTYEAELEVKFYCDDIRDDYKVRDMLLSGEFDEDSLEDLEDGDDLEDYVLEDEE